MSKKIKLKFEPNQEHQLKAVDSIAGLFKGLPPMEVGFQMGDDIVANLPRHHDLQEEWLLANLQQVQDDCNAWAASIDSSTQIPKTLYELEYDQGPLIEGIGEEFESHRYPSFTVEMETGTGKTYVYLRAMQELRKQYGFRKFIVVVPSIAIYEGVIKSFAITREHFKMLYGNETIGLTQYDSQQISKLRNFATSSFTEILVMTVDSFNRKANNIYKATEKLPGERKPYQFIQETKPVLILDESQNYLTANAKAALRTMRPLFALKFSATPKEKSNPIFRLGPVDSLKLNLVKKIQVWGVKEDYNVNDPLMSLTLLDIRTGAHGWAAKFMTLVNEKGKLAEKVIELKTNENLFDKTKNELHRNVVIESINKKEGTVLFKNGDEMELKGDEAGMSVSKREIFRVQIENTIREHFSRQKELRKMGVKVLSLFFIDRVAHYTGEEGVIKKLFDEIFEKLKLQDTYFKKLKAEEVRQGYFAKKKTKTAEEFIDTPVDETKKTNEQKEQEKAAYELIMKDKEKLLNFDEKVSFIFAHSALREGWDNPNVFQICTLNTATSETRKRQEIGRGLRICVNQEGQRVMDEGVNILTVIPNESYRSYAENLQREYREDGDLDYPPPSNASRTDARRNNKIFKLKEFKNFWETVCRNTFYTIRLNTERLVEDCISKFNNHQFQFPEPRIVITKGEFIIATYDIKLVEVKVGFATVSVEIKDTAGGHVCVTHRFKKGADLSLLAGDERLKGFKIVEISGVGQDPEVKFGNSQVLRPFEPIQFQVEKSTESEAKMVQEQQTVYPVFNLIDRVSRELGITRSTILRIFKGIGIKKKEAIFKNPEGFSAVFIDVIKENLANQVAETIEYSLSGEIGGVDIEEAFPENKKYVQKELIDGSRNSLYDQIQVDSKVEKRFIQFKVQERDLKGNIICYFKFPNTFKVNIPKIIGNYNPDWGIIYLDEKGKTALKLVRETKGNTDTGKLRFTNEGRKIDCAVKHFKAIGIDYRTVDDKIDNWWLPDVNR